MKKYTRFITDNSFHLCHLNNTHCEVKNLVINSSMEEKGVKSNNHNHLNFLLINQIIERGIERLENTQLLSQFNFNHIICKHSKLRCILNSFEYANRVIKPFVNSDSVLESK